MTRPNESNDHDDQVGRGSGQPFGPPEFGRPEPIPPQTPWAQLPPAGQPNGGVGNRGEGRPASRPDASAATALLVAFPWFFWSLVIVLWISNIFGGWKWLVIALWILSGAIIFAGPVEDLVARFLYRLRRPTLIEDQRLGPIWQQVERRAGVEGGRLSIWIQESDEVNATPTPGHTVAVTRWALYTLPPSHLEAVLANELSHHMGGRAWLSLLSFWYSIPARCALIGVRALVHLMRKVPALGCAVGGFLILAYSGILLAVITFGDGYSTAFLFLTPFIAPPFLAWMSRWEVKQADRRTAMMGYGATLVQVLYGWQMQNQQTLGRETNRRAQLMSSMPSLIERVRALELANQTMPPTGTA